MNEWVKRSKEALEAARKVDEILGSRECKHRTADIEYHCRACFQDRISDLLDHFAAKARLREARWWGKDSVHHSDAEKIDRIAELERLADD